MNIKNDTLKLNDEKTFIPTDLIKNHTGLESTDLLVYAYLVKELLIKRIPKESFSISPIVITKALKITKHTFYSSIKRLEENHYFNSKTNELFYYLDNEQIELNEKIIKNISRAYFNDELLSDKRITAAQKITLIGLSVFTFNEKSNQHLNGISKQLNIPVSTLKKHLPELKMKNYLNYSTPIVENKNKKKIVFKSISFISDYEALTSDMEVEVVNEPETKVVNEIKEEIKPAIICEKITSETFKDYSEEEDFNLVFNSLINENNITNIVYKNRLYRKAAILWPVGRVKNEDTIQIYKNELAEEINLMRA